MTPQRLVEAGGLIAAERGRIAHPSLAQERVQFDSLVPQRFERRVELVYQGEHYPLKAPPTSKDSK